MSHRILHALLALALLAVGTLATPAGAQRPADQMRVLAPTGTLTLETRKGRLIQLDSPIAAVFIADPEIADIQAQSPTILYLYGKRSGTTTIYAVDDQQQIVLRHEVVVQHNLGRLRAALREMAQDNEVQVQSVDAGLILTGVLPSAVAAQEVREVAARFIGESETLVNRLTVAAPTQVSLHVRVAEMSRDVAKVFGINWDVVATPGDFVFGLATGRTARDAATGMFNRFSDTAGLAGAIAASGHAGDVDFNALIDALERESLVSVLAEPNLTALSGETASFLAGGEFPIPVGQGDNEIQIEFKQYGVSLAFTPTVLTPGRISLRVRPEVSDITEKGAIKLDGITIPAIVTRRAETTVELGSGQSFAIGGLISNNMQDSVDKFPGLGDLPVLGPLFRSTRFKRSETELVIIVTPYLVRPSSTALASPGAGMRAPHDAQLILDGALNRPGVAPGLRRPPSAGRAPSAGFVLE